MRAPDRPATILVVGMCSRDTFLQLEGGLGSDEAVVIVAGSAERIGGKGLLVARAIEEFSEAKAVVIAEVAASESEFADIDFVVPLPVLDADHRIWVVTGSDGDQRSFVRPGAPIGMPDHDEHWWDKQVGRADLLYVSAESMDVLEHVVDAWAKALRQPQIALNPCMPLQDRLEGRPDLHAWLLQAASYVILNESEWQRLQSRSGLHAGLAPGAVLIVTEGDRGGRYRVGQDSEWSRFSAAPAVSGRTSAGAGDTFTGVLLGRLVDGHPVEEALAGAAEVAAAYVTELRSALG